MKKKGIKEKMINKKTMQITLLVVIIISMILIIMAASGNITKSYNFKTITLDEINSENIYKDFDVIEVRLTNENSITPKRIEVKPIYGCLYNSENDELLLYRQLNSYDYRTDSSEIFSLNEEFIDIPAKSTITIDHSINVNTEDLNQISEINYNFYIKYYELSNSRDRYSYWNYEFAKDICEEEVSADLIYPNN